MQWCADQCCPDDASVEVGVGHSVTVSAVISILGADKKCFQFHPALGMSHSYAERVRILSHCTQSKLLIKPDRYPSGISVSSTLDDYLLQIQIHIKSVQRSTALLCSHNIAVAIPG